MWKASKRNDIAAAVCELFTYNTMTIQEFKESTSKESPLPGLSNLLQAMWYDAKGDWESAHNLAQEVETRDGSWLHAYLHRKEGDLSNASYWYSRAGKPLCKKSLNEEWEEIVQALLR